MIEDFILTYPNFFSKEECEKTINLFDKAKQAGFTLTRKIENNIPNHIKNDDQLYYEKLIESNEITSNNLIVYKIFNEKFWNKIYPLYTSKYSILNDAPKHVNRLSKIQKTEIGEGYHLWHCEDLAVDCTRRILVYILYLNDVTEGGETEFLYYHKRIKPTAGTLIIWPAGFTHTHRGNPPISNNKYIYTGWVELE